MPLSRPRRASVSKAMSFATDVLLVDGALAMDDPGALALSLVEC
jgi:hypothetical protein